MMTRMTRMFFSLSCPSWLLLLLLSAALQSSELRGAEGLKVTSTGQQTIQKAEGESVILGCSYAPGPLDSGELDIEWSVVSPDTTKKDRMLVSYTRGIKYNHCEEAFAAGLSFAAGDPSKGDASLSITQLLESHSATYQCKVKKPPGADMHKMTLVVMVKPSEPECWLEGEELVGEAVSLHCKSAGGSTPLRYQWRRESTDPLSAAATQNSATGELKISNHSQSFAGIYLCEVNNAVGSERCRINLKVNKPPNRAGVIFGNIVGSLLLTFILLVFVVLFYWKLKDRHRDEKEFSNEIREDASPPDSRPGSRHTSQPTAQSSRSTFCQVNRNQVSSSYVGRTHSPSENSHGQVPVKYTPVEYDNGYVV